MAPESGENTQKLKRGSRLGNFEKHAALGPVLLLKGYPAIYSNSELDKSWLQYCKTGRLSNVTYII